MLINWDTSTNDCISYFFIKKIYTMTEKVTGFKLNLSADEEPKIAA